MGDKPLVIHPAALAELESAVKWYWQRSSHAATRFAAELDRAIGLVLDSPKRWPEGPNSTHRFPLRRFPFAIVYRESAEAIQLLAVAHGHRRPDYWKDRL